MQLMWRCNLHVFIVWAICWLSSFRHCGCSLFPRVAVVGAGTGGAFTAARLAELAHPDRQPEVEIFEAGSSEGGRLADFTFDGEALELGASIFWDHNYYIKRAAERLGLRLRRVGGRGASRQDVESETRPLTSPGGGGGGGSEDGPAQRDAGGRVEGEEAAPQGGAAAAAGAKGGERGFAVWNGTALVFNMTGSWTDTLRAFLRYGTAALRYKWLVKDAFKRFRQVYDLQEGGTAWETPEQLLRNLNLYDETQQRCSDYMRHWLESPSSSSSSSSSSSWWLWGGAEFANELAGAANRCNYNQNNDEMNAFAGLVSYMPATYGAIWQIDGGNRRLVTGMLAASGARLISPARVIAVRQLPAPADSAAGRPRYLLDVRVTRGQRGGATERSEDEAPAADPDPTPAGGDDAEGESVQVFGPYDAVVITAPLTGSEINFDLGNDGGGSSSSSVDGGRNAISGVALPDDAAAAAADGAAASAAWAAALETTSTRELAAAAADTDGAAAASGPGDGGPETILYQPYQVTVTTYVEAGRLRPAFFNVSEMPPVARVFVTSDARTPFSALAIRPAGRSASGGGGGGGAELRVYKFFSREELPLELFQSMFEPAPAPPRLLDRRRWYAYPRFRPPERFSPFLLAPGLVYGNALEPAASALEIAAIEAHNSALLVLRHLGALSTGAEDPQTDQQQDQQQQQKEEEEQQEEDVQHHRQEGKAAEGAASAGAAAAAAAA